MKLTIDIPDNIAQRVLNGYALAKGYTESESITKMQYAKQMIIEHIREHVKAYEFGQAIRSAETQIDFSMENDINLS